MMERHFEKVEAELRERILHMGGVAEEMIRQSEEALLERREAPIVRIAELEEEMNRLHIELDDRCLKLLALHQPIAADLRFIMACIKINSDLERIGDQAVNISQSTAYLLRLPPIDPPPFDIRRMVALARQMLRDSLEAMARKEVALAESVAHCDAEEDGLKKAAFIASMRLMQSDPSTIERALTLILITRNLERIADHATNIAEDVIFWAKGEDIRHNRNRKETNP